ncbi:MAG: glycosyltransferase family 2 protein [Candidatus Marinimicrobia bacterium]|nr:glycosyltransferase family 2 protein [Candidatus Neomarinimicrobiota bacterium]MCF7904011.1 glycosyltransferase family 2 protein [Candidatus Neomarinimicrobiota bacterium]
MHNSSEADPQLQLSVLIVTYNSRTSIQACVSSLLQELSSIRAELIIVDNNSTDGTQDELTKIAATNPSVVIQLNKKNRGFAVGNNQALHLATGEHILILNPDTQVLPGSVTGLLQALSQNETTGAVAPQLKFPDGRIQKTCRRFPKYRDVIFHSLGLAQLFPQSQFFNGWKMGDFDHTSKQEVDQPAGAALLVRGSLIRDLQGFDLSFPMFFNDVDLCRRIKDSGYEVWYLPKFQVIHEGGASVKQARVKMVISSHLSFFRYFEKHFTRLHHQPMNFLIAFLLYLSLIPRILALFSMKPKREISRDTL